MNMIFFPCNYFVRSISIEKKFFILAWLQGVFLRFRMMAVTQKQKPLCKAEGLSFLMDMTDRSFNEEKNRTTGLDQVVLDIDVSPYRLGIGTYALRSFHQG